MTRRSVCCGAAGCDAVFPTAKAKMLHWADVHSVTRARPKAREVSCWACATRFTPTPDGSCPNCGWAHPYLASNRPAPAAASDVPLPMCTFLVTGGNRDMGRIVAAPVGGRWYAYWTAGVHRRVVRFASGLVASAESEGALVGAVFHGVVHGDVTYPHEWSLS